MSVSNEIASSENPIGWRLENTYAELPESLFAVAAPAKLTSPKLVILNGPLAKELGLDFDLSSGNAVEGLLSGQLLPNGSLPIAQAYAGHQYGHFTMLGDGRAILLGEHRTPGDRLVDIQLKGAGQTRFSRRGDGRAALGPMLREYLISESMFALGIPTTRSLAVVATGESVYRGTMLPGAILVRIASSHIRVGTFEYLAARKDTSGLQALADYTISRHYPELQDASSKYLEFLKAVVDRQASLIAKWQLVGFVHGVMNTDNMAISGETIDYGPCAFMNSYDPKTVFSSIDHGGRYAYGNQPAIGQWNLARFAEALLPLLAPESEAAVAIAEDVLQRYAIQFETYWLSSMRRKLGLTTAEADDLDLAESLLLWMDKTSADFTNTFRSLSSSDLAAPVGTFDSEFHDWRSRWFDRLARESRSLEDAQAAMRSVNPAIIPRNHRVEEALMAAEQRGDILTFHRLAAALSRPFEPAADAADWLQPSPDDGSYQTFCGT
jgi:uncharacterized protein YdiU (UPF0061 family)